MVNFFKNVFEEVKELCLAITEFLDALSLVMIIGTSSMLPVWIIVGIIFESCILDFCWFYYLTWFEG